VGFARNSLGTSSFTLKAQRSSPTRSLRRNLRYPPLTKRQPLRGTGRGSRFSRGLESGSGSIFVRTFLRHATNLLLGGVGIVLAALVVLRLLHVERRGLEQAMIAYASPWLLLLVGTLCLAIIVKRRKLPVFAVIMSVFAGVCLLAWIQTGVRFRRPAVLPPGSESIRLVFWNADHYGAGFFEPVVRLAELDADLLVLAESNASHGPQKAAFAQHFPKHEYLFAGMDFTMALGPGYSVKKKRFDWFRQPGRRYDRKNWANAVIVDLETPAGGLLRVIGFDQASDLQSDRVLHLGQLARLLEKESEDGVPIVLVGDFNVPADTVALDVLRRAGWERAFEASGRGLGETWPTPLPFLALDQCWTREGITVLSLRHADMDWKGAHQALILDFGIDLPAP